MAIPVSSSANRLADLPAYTPPTTTANASKGASGNDATPEVATPRAQAATQLNGAIVQAQLNLSSQNDPLALVLKSAITGINEQLAPQFGENAIQNAVSQDNSPEGTAGRIVSLSTAFLQAFKDQHPDLSDDEATSKFLDTIKSGIEQGFKEARDILGGLNVLNGDVASNIDKTYDLVQQGLARFATDHGIDQGGDGATTGKPAANGNTGVVGPQGSRVEVSVSETRSVSFSYSSSNNTSSNAVRTQA